MTKKFIAVLCMISVLFSTVNIYAAEKVANPKVKLPQNSKFAMKNGHIITECEDMSHTSDVALIQDENASGKAALRMAGAVWREEVDPLADPDVYMDFVPDISGKAYIWVRIKTENTGSDSVFYSCDGGDYIMKAFGSGALKDPTAYYWSQFDTLNLTKGKLTRFSIQYRELNFTMDKLIITKDASFKPSGIDDIPGGSGSNSSSSGQFTGLYPETPIKPIKGHPRLLFTQSDIPQILKNIQHPHMNEIFAKEEAAADEPIDGKLNTDKINNYDNHILSCIINRALFYALGLRDASHGRVAVEAMKNYFDTVSYNPSTADITRDMGNTMMAGAAVYDWCYDLLTENEKQKFISDFKATASMKEVGYPPNKRISISGHGGEGEIFGHLLSAGIAVYDEDKEIYEVSAGRMFSEFLDIRKMWNKTGAHPIGHTYATTRYDWELIANLLFVRMGYKDGILGEFDNLARVAKKFMYARLPMGYMMKLGDDWMWMRSENMSWFWTPYPGTTYNLAAVQTGDPYLKQAGAIQNYIAGYPISYNTLIPSILLIDPEADGKFADTLPLANKTDYPLSSIQARTNWTMGIDSDAAVAHFEAREKMIQDHQHADLGSFQLYYKGYLAINAGTYAGTGGGWGSSHWYNYYSRTIAHNCMTVYDPNEEFYVDYHGKTGDKLSNDGGQINTQLVSTYEEFLSNPDEAKTEAWYIGPNKETPEYSFIKTNLTGAYGNNKVKSHERSMVFMDLDNGDYPAAVVIFDDVHASSPTFRKAWIMNTQLEPSVSGNTSTVVRNDNGNNGKLVNKTLLPMSPEVKTVGGEGMESWVDGVNYESKDKYPGQYSEQGMWRIEVSPTSKNERDYFLNSMYVTDYDRNLPELPMHKEENSKLFGVTVMDRAVYFPKNDRINSAFQIDVRQNGYESVKCLVTDVESGLWKVTDATSGSFKVYRVSDDENTLYFRAAPGRVTIEKMASGEADNITYPKLNKPHYGDFMVYDTVSKMFYPLKNPTVIKDGVELVPAREFFEYNKFDVEWSDGTITASSKDSEYKFAIGSNVMSFNGTEIQMSTAPINMGGVSYINPCDFALFRTDYDPQARILGIKALNYESYEKAGFSGFVVPISVSASGNDGNVEDNLFDGRFDTRWSSDVNGAWVLFELDNEYTIEEIAVAFYSGDKRSTKFKLEASTDGKSFDEIFSGESGGESADAEIFGLNSAAKAKYIRLTCYGNSLNAWNSVSEVIILKGN